MLSAPCSLLYAHGEFMELTGKSAIVTGAGRGIGKAIATMLGHAGAKVVVAARTRAEIEAVAQEIKAGGAEAIAIPVDVSVPSEVMSMVSMTVDRFGGVDILVNNAGIGSFATVADMSVEQFDRMWEVNMRGVFLCTRAVLPHMVKGREGDVLNIASLAGRNAFIGGSAYCATKWALVGFARCLMLEVRENNIRVITLCPGSVETGFADHEGAKSSPAIPKPHDIAQVAIDTLRMPRHVMVSEVDIRPTNPKG